MEAILKTKIGKLYISFSERGLSVLSFKVPSKILRDDIDEPFAQEVLKELEEYFSGSRENFDLKLDLSGTDFQMKVWKQLKKIKYGKTSSYGDISNKIGLNKGARAVGGANNKNPIPIIIPCHRVIQSDGQIGGYAGGVALKEKLLALEKIL